MRRVNGTFKDIGNGLFAGINYRAGQRIAYFRGTVVTTEEYESRENQRYGLELGDYFVLDCAEQAGRGICKASMANTPRGLHFKSDLTKMAESNCQMDNNVIGKYCYLEAIRDIESGEELFWEYGRNFNISP